ncbi:hypothetical protein RJ639_046137 [Escallonia herrerae]|uniref:Protein kinase domain-containing protein n=1 Tax=Escallonia herrerae TaxID=1293975 RepID=A0AA88W971_9ASTE|nr:hypothetical protein RJ639_046137 [Escallonia herrerae]
MDKYSVGSSFLACRVFRVVVIFVAAAIFGLGFVQGTTDPADDTVDEHKGSECCNLFVVQALQVIYTSLNNPSQLTNWKPTGGDPCGESWKGIICQGTAVVSLQVPGLGLSGTLGYLLSALTSLRTLDVSGNNIHDSVPYQLPPNLTSLNVSHNSLAQAVGDVFANLSDLATLDLSFNNFSGDLPNSFSTLSNLSTLHVQNNQLTGALNVLAGLPLTDLYDGNSFDNGPAPPPPPYTPPPPGRSHNNRSHSPPGSRTPGSDGRSANADNKNEKKGLAVGPIIGIIAGSLLVALLALLVLVLCLRKGKKKESSAKTSIGSLPVTTDKGCLVTGNEDVLLHVVHVKTVSDRQIKAERTFKTRAAFLIFQWCILLCFLVNTVMQEQMVKPTASLVDLKPLPAENLIVERTQGKHGSAKRVKSPLTATSYTVAGLQTATNSFSQENLIGEGSLGRVYKAEFSNGKIMAIKKIDNAALSLQEEDHFLEVVSNMSRLRHPNIVPLAGYCAEHGQRLLVYEYVGNGSLQDMLHFADDRSKTLTWNARVRVALGTARALEYVVYLHEVCLPSVVHRNFKSANILLDEELNPHLSDCGLAALSRNTERQVSSTQMVGSFGYSAPEFALSGIYTVKSDVYSFGVVMLELLTGRKPLDSSRVRSEQSLVRWATPQLHDIDALAKMVDPALNGMYPAKSLSRFADIIALCVQPEPEFRPPMSEVVQALVRLMQRASVVKRRSNDESGFMYRTPDHEAYEMSY